MQRFVILHHLVESDLTQEAHEQSDSASLMVRGSHWDLMFEVDGNLLTWAVPSEPLPGYSGLAWRLADHRLAYLEFEGEISGGRGSVKQVHSGNFQTLNRTEREFVVQLMGDIEYCIDLKFQSAERGHNELWQMLIRSP